MDVKLEGLSKELMREALQQARDGRLFILDKMLQVLPESRSEISTYAPRLITMKIAVSKIRDVIGPGGKVIRGIIEQTGVKIDVQDDGTVTIASVDEAAAKKAQSIIEGITAEAEKGRTYLGKVQRIAEYGAFVEILPNAVGLLHVSEMAPYRVREVRDLVTEGQEIMVRVVEIGDDGKIRLSHKEFAQQTPPPGYDTGAPPRPRGEGRDRDHHGDRDRGYRRDDRPRFGDRGDRGDRGERGDRDRDRPRSSSGPRRTYRGES
jgi:polyribonucleotide nucleotidyltransferase